jgi:hypothetical protein
MKLGGLEPSSLEDARARLHALEAELGIIHVTGPAGYVASVAQVENATLPRLIHVRPGTYDVRARAPDGRTFLRVAVAQPGLGVEVAFAPPSVAPEPVRSPDPQRTIGWVTAGTGVALGVVTAVLGFSALAARDRFAASGYTDDDARSDASALRTWTNVTLVAAAVFVVGGVALALTAPKRPSQPRP